MITTLINQDLIKLSLSADSKEEVRSEEHTSELQSR